MPCQAPEPTKEELLREFEEGVLKSQSYLAMKSKTIELTQLLCEACKILEKYKAPVSIPLNSWWLNHKEQDKKNAK